MDYVKRALTPLSPSAPVVDRIVFPLDHNQVARLHQVRYTYSFTDSTVTGSADGMLSVRKDAYENPSAALDFAAGPQVFAHSRIYYSIATEGGRGMITSEIIPLLGLDVGENLYIIGYATGSGLLGDPMEIEIWWEPVDVGSGRALAVRAQEGT